MVIPAKIIVEMLSASMCFLFSGKVTLVLFEIVMPFHTKIPFFRLEKSGFGIMRISLKHKTTLAARRIIGHDNRVPLVPTVYGTHISSICLATHFVMNS